MPSRLDNQQWIDIGGLVNRVTIGMDPHKRSATIEVMDPDEVVLGSRRFGTDQAGYDAMLRYGRQWSDRVWPIEGCQGLDSRPGRVDSDTKRQFA